MISRTDSRRIIYSGSYPEIFRGGFWDFILKNSSKKEGGVLTPAYTQNLRLMFLRYINVMNMNFFGYTYIDIVMGLMLKSVVI